MLKRVITWAVLIFVIYMLATDPSGVSSHLHSAWDVLGKAAESLTNFFQGL